MADKIAPGFYTFREALTRAGVDFDEAVTVKNDDGTTRVDHRRVLVGGLGFDDPDQTFVVTKLDGDEFIPEGGHPPVEIRVDGKLKGKLEVDQDQDFRAARELPDHALLPHVDPEETETKGRAVTKLVPKRDLSY